MKSKLSIFFIATLIIFIGNDGRLRGKDASPAPSNPRRIRFQITTIEEKNGQRNILSKSAVEGPPGTDFDINVDTDRFKMRAPFMTDVLNDGTLRVRTKLHTSRLFGYSSHNLPLYETDTQNQDLQLGFDEEIVLLPFGRNGGDDLLKIEITPLLSEETTMAPNGKRRPLQIDLGNINIDGISIQAATKPHRFVTEATLYENGQEAARGEIACLLDDYQELSLQPINAAAANIIANPLAIKLKIEDYVRSRPIDETVIRFDLDRIVNSKHESFARNWSGEGPLGTELKYDLTDYFPNGNGHRYELRFKVRLADGESAD